MPQFNRMLSSVVTRRIIRCKYFQSIKLNSRVFHTARPLLVRGVLTDKKSVESNTAPGTEIGPVDFFGIESDVGVIYAKDKIPSTEKCTDLNSSSSSKKERLLETPFGHLRLDSDNQPTFHGQFDENIRDATFTYGSDAQIEKMQNIKTRKRRRISKLEELFKATSRKENGESVEGTKETELSGSEFLVSKDNESIHDEPKTSGNDSYGKNVISTEDTDECDRDLSFIDRQYFHSESCDVMGKNVQPESAVDHHNEEWFIHLNEKNCDKKNRQNETENNLKSRKHDHHSNYVGSSYIDSIYFEGLDGSCVSHSETESKPVAPHSENLTHSCAVSSTESKTHENVRSESNFIDSFYFGDLLKESRSSSDVGNSGGTPEAQNIDPGLDSAYEAYENRIFLAGATSESAKGRNLELQKQVSPLRQSQVFSVLKSKTGCLEDSPKEKEVLKDLGREIMASETELDSFQGPIEDVKNSNANGVQTAYKYVLKLRKTEMVPEAQKGGKFDSKGFRILKHLVPDLSQLTRTELLDLLKERVLFSNNDIVILNKPYNLVVHESQTTKLPTLSSLLDDFACMLDTSAAHPQLYTVHRLDKETTGCLLLARNELAAQKLKALFVKHEIEKSYMVVTTRVPDPYEGVIDIPIAEGKIENRARMVLQPDLPHEIKYNSHVKNGKKATTYYKVLSTSENAALLEVKPETGLKHQIRVHLGFGLNCPILGDHKYSHLTKMAPQKIPGDMLRKLGIRQSKVRYVPMHIHARAVFIPRFLEEKDLFVSAPLPEHMRDTLKRLKFK